MELKPINQRLKILLEKLGVSARTFSEMIGEKSSNTQNYVGARNSTPGADYIEKVLRHFESINPAWLLLGDGEPFKEGAVPAQNQTTISGDGNNVASGKNVKAIQKTYNLSDCERERDVLRVERDGLAKQVELLTGQLKMQETIIQGKDQMLEMLRGGITRPN